MRIALALEPGGGGSARHFLDLASGLIARGLDVHIGFSRLRAEPWFLNALDRLSAPTKTDLALHRGVGPWDMAAASRVNAWLRRVQPEVAHGHSSKAGALVRLAAPPGVARVYTPHAFITMQPQAERLKNVGYRMAEFALFSCTDRLIATSSYEADHARALGARGSLVQVVPNGLTPIPFLSREDARRHLGLPLDALVVGWIGRMSAQKRPTEYVEAVRLVFAEAPDAALAVMIGTGELLPTVQATIVAAGLQQRVILKSHEQAYVLMRAFDVFVLSSSYEGFAYVLLEALQAGLPIISTLVGGASESISEGENGFLTPIEGATPLLAQRLLLLLKDPALRASMAAAALAKSGAFTLDRMVDATLQVYTHAIEQARSKR